MIIFFFFFFNDTATTEIYTLSLHDALPISDQVLRAQREDRLQQHRIGQQRQKTADIRGSIEEVRIGAAGVAGADEPGDRKSTRLNSSHLVISYAVFCLKKKTKNLHLQTYVE